MPGVQQRDAIRPELMSGMSQEGGHQCRNGGRCSRRIGVPGMSHDPQHPVFCVWASRPGFLAGLGKPSMCLVMQDMRGVDQGDQHIYVQQEPYHGNSSRNLCTSSEVTREVFAWTGSSGTPFRVFRSISAGRSARRARAEMTSPTLLRSAAASSFAAASTSSSIAKVVRMAKQLPLFAYHQSSYIRCGVRQVMAWSSRTPTSKIWVAAI